MTRAGRENCVWPFVFTGILFFFPKWSASRKKKLENSKVDFCMNWQQIDDRLCGPIHGRHRIDRSVSHSVCPTMSFWHRDSRKLCLRSFLLPEALYRGNAIYRQWSAYTGGKKRYTRIVHIRAYLAPGRRGVNWIFRPVSFGVTFHNVCHISAGHSAFAMPQIEKGGQKKTKIFCSFCSTIVVELRICSWIHENPSTLGQKLFLYDPGVISIMKPFVVILERCFQSLNEHDKMQIMKFEMIKWNRCRNF